MNEELVETFICIVCNDYIRGVIYSCDNGHILCYDCYCKTKQNGNIKCPICRCVNLFRNKFSENISKICLREIKAKCKFDCDFDDFVPKLLNHENKCLKRSIKCFSNFCNWEGHLEDFYEHAKSQECVDIVDDFQLVNNKYTFNINKKNVNKLLVTNNIYGLPVVFPPVWIMGDGLKHKFIFLNIIFSNNFYIIFCDSPLPDTTYNSPDIEIEVKKNKLHFSFKGICSNNSDFLNILSLQSDQIDALEDDLGNINLQLSVTLNN
uniref:RING-type domain-containing protein n=1 Tax=viral metagenome TaxID=1070528 RepID=A0A6C0JDW5_9ZZZZ